MALAALAEAFPNHAAVPTAQIDAFAAVVERCARVYLCVCVLCVVMCVQCARRAWAAWLCAVCAVCAHTRVRVLEGDCACGAVGG